MPEAATRTQRFRDRAHAGRLLAERLREYAGRDDVVVLALPRGGVPVGYEIARALDAPLDVFLVRKLGVPGHEEHALGAIATGGIRVLNTQLIESLNLPAEWVEAIDAKERRELQRRERTYRGDRPPPDVAGRTVILVDDGLATGATMLAALHALRADEPARIVVAAPVADPAVCESLLAVADDVECLHTPRPFRAVGVWYEDFSQTSDDEVRVLLEQARRPPVARGPEAVRPLRGETTDYDDLIERATRARFVLIGEASHGTQEFYRQRAEITKRLIAEGGFTAVAVEADWPDAYRVNRFVRAASDDSTAEEALGDFRRFPTWMWRNTDVEAFVRWLRRHNEGRDAAAMAGFYGLDLYNLGDSMRAVIDYLDDVDPAAARLARERYGCLMPWARDPALYGRLAITEGYARCERPVVEMLRQIQARRWDYAAQDGEEWLDAAGNARLVKNAEAYYRAMYHGAAESWNLRDTHMFETLCQLLDTKGPKAKAVVWAHNSHIGNARFTEMGRDRDELNIGQLVKERFGDAARLIGFGTHQGTVAAAPDWDGPMEVKAVRPSLPDSYERLSHDSGLPRFLLDLREGRNEPLRGALAEPRLERFIGVIYRPETERWSHYSEAILPQQYDAWVWFDETTAVTALPGPERPGEDDLWPFGL